MARSNISKRPKFEDLYPSLDKINVRIAKKAKPMNTENQVNKTEEKEAPKYFYVKRADDYGMRETFEEALAEAQNDAMEASCDQYILKAVKRVKRPDAAVWTTIQDIH